MNKKHLEVLLNKVVSEEDIAKILQKVDKYYAIDINSWNENLVMNSEDTKTFLEIVDRSFVQDTTKYDFHIIRTDYRQKSIRVDGINNEDFYLERMRDVMGLEPEKKED